MDGLFKAETGLSSINTAKMGGMGANAGQIQSSTDMPLLFLLPFTHTPLYAWPRLMRRLWLKSHFSNRRAGKV